MPDLKDELLRIAHHMRQEGEFEWARLVMQAADQIKQLEKAVEDNRVINEILTGGQKD